MKSDPQGPGEITPTPDVDPKFPKPTVVEPKVVTMWAHGHSLVVESGNYPLKGHQPNLIELPNDTALRVRRFGWGAELSMGPTNEDGIGRKEKLWIHYSIPTPSQWLDKPVQARRLIMRCLGSANPGITFYGIHVYDGPKKILNNNQYFNSYAPPPGFQKEFMPHDPFPTVEFGIGVSLLVGGDRATWDHKLSIHAVGMEFLVRP